MKKFFPPIITAILFSFVWVAGKYLADVIPPITMTFLRYCFVAIVFFPVMIYYRKTIRAFTRYDWFYLLLASLLSVVAYHTLFYWALHYSSPTTLSLIHAANPLLTLALSYFILKHPITKHVIIGFCLAVLGVVIVVSNGEEAALTLSRGEWLMLAATLSWAGFTIVAKHVSPRIPSLVFTVSISFLGWFILLPLTFWEVDLSFFQSISPSSWLALLYMGIGSSSIGYWLYARSIGHIGPAYTSFIVMSLVPLFVAVEAWFWLGTPVGWEQIIGFIFICVGLAVGLYSPLWLFPKTK